MEEPVIAIGVGFFIIMCMMVKFTGINTIPGIVDNTDNTDDTEVTGSDIYSDTTTRGITNIFNWNLN